MIILFKREFNILFKILLVYIYIQEWKKIMLDLYLGKSFLYNKNIFTNISRVAKACFFQVYKVFVYVIVPINVRILQLFCRMSNSDKS